MGLRKLKPTTPGTRFRSYADFSEITKHRPEKKLTAPLKRSGGRNKDGKMTMRYIGGGAKRRYRIIDFKRDKHQMPATVLSIEYDPNRTCRIALVEYKDGEKRYILCPEGLKVGQIVVSGTGVEPTVGNAMTLKEVPLGAIIHNIEMTPGKGGVIARGAGCYAQLTSREDRYALLKMPSGELRRILLTCMATIGAIGNADNMNISLGKAGRNRWLGRRPRNRGVSMNPVDHPMGGGEGKASGGIPRSRKGIPAKGFKTRKKKKHSSKYIVARRPSRKKRK